MKLINLVAWLHVNLFTEEIWRARAEIGVLTLTNARLRVQLFYYRHLKP